MKLRKIPVIAIAASAMLGAAAGGGLIAHFLVPKDAAPAAVVRGETEEMLEVVKTSLGATLGDYKDEAAKLPPMSSTYAAEIDTFLVCKMNAIKVVYRTLVGEATDAESRRKMAEVVFDKQGLRIAAYRIGQECDKAAAHTDAKQEALTTTILYGFVEQAEKRLRPASLTP